MIQSRDPAQHSLIWPSPFNLVSCPRMTKQRELQHSVLHAWSPTYTIITMSRTPIREHHEAHKHYSYYTKAAVVGTISFLEAKKIPHTKSDVFRFFEMSNTQGWRTIQEGVPRSMSDDPDRKETRGRKRLVTEEQVQAMEQILQNDGPDGRGKPWKDLGLEVGCKASGRTIKRAMEEKGYQKCSACHRNRVSKSTPRRDSRNLTSPGAPFLQSPTVSCRNCMHR